MARGLQSPRNCEVPGPVQNEIEQLEAPYLQIAKEGRPPDTRSLNPPTEWSSRGCSSGSRRATPDLVKLGGPLRAGAPPGDGRASFRAMTTCRMLFPSTRL
jgi:hypothetical protein